MSKNTITVDMNLKLYDGDGGAAAAEGGANEGAQSVSAQSTQQSRKEASPEDLSLARANGIPDRLATDYAAAKRKMAAQTDGNAESESTQQSEALTETKPEDRSARFSEMIRKGGEFHEDYENRLNENLNRRMKSVNEQNAQLSKQADGYNKIAEILAMKYGVDSTDIDSLVKAVQGDDSYFEQMALDNGMTVSEQRAKLEADKRVNELEQKVKQYEQRDSDFETKRYLDSEAEKLKTVYPDFDISEELQNNPDFSKMLAITKQVYGKENVQIAYEMANRDKHLNAVVNAMGGQMQTAMARQIEASGRPQSNANLNSVTAPAPKSINQMSKNEIAELAAEAKRTGLSVSEILRRRN